MPWRRGGSAGSAGAGPAVLDILLAGWIFTRVSRDAVRTGLIARCSVGSVS